MVKGGFWVFSLRLAKQLFNLGRLVILARILNPYDLGLMGIALLTMATLETFSQTGFQQALIQKKDDIKSFLDATWTVLILRGFILFAILYLIAPYAAIFFNAPEVKPIIRVVGISILIQAFTNIGVVYFQKELEFNKQFIYQASKTLVDAIVTISGVLILKNVWALVFGLLAGNTVRSILSYFIHPYRPCFSSDLGKLKELFGYGRWVFGSSILIFLITQGDHIFVGKLFGATMLGFYQMAYLISNLQATEITNVITEVTFPAYSKLQDSLLKLRKTYLTVLQHTAFLSFPITGLIFIFAPDFTKIFFGEKWMPMVPAMQILVFWGLIRSIGATIGPMFQGIGKPEISTKLQFIQLIFLAILIYPLSIQNDILGTSLAVVFAGLISNLTGSYIAIKTIKCSLWNFCKMMVVPAINIIIVFSFIQILKTYWIESVGILEFLLLIILSIIIYFVITYFFYKFYNYRIWAFKIVSQVYYRFPRIRNIEKALSYTYSFKIINSVLKTEQEVEESLQIIKNLKLRHHVDRPKNWDSFRGFLFIIKHGNKDSKILDVGSSDYGVILPWLELYGFTNLYGCDISFKNDFRKGRIKYCKQDLQNTNFPSKSFDFITSISVIEHGVKIDAYLMEMSRLLKEGGYLITSTDYWPEPIDTKGLHPYGKELGEMKIFTRTDIEKLVKKAQEYRLELIKPIDFSYKDKIVHWNRVSKRFTFIFFILRKIK